MTEETREQAALYALGLLEPEERSALEREASQDGELAAQLGDDRAVLAALALAAPSVSPPRHLRGALLERAARTVVGGKRRRLFPTYVPWAIAAGLVVTTALGWRQAWQLRQEIAALRAAADVTSWQVARLESNAADLAGIRASVVWNPGTNRGVLRAVELPLAPAGKTYQVWVFEKGSPTPRPAGVFAGGEAREVPFQPAVAVREAVAFAVSIEPDGGSAQPTGPVILSGGV